MREAIADSIESIEGLSVVTQNDLEQNDDINLDDVDIDIDIEEEKAVPKKKAKASSGKTGDEDIDAKVNRKELDATRLYLREIEGSPLLTAEEEVFYSRLALKGDMEARKKMIECNLRLVVKISRRYMNRGLALLDPVSYTHLRAHETMTGISYAVFCL